MPLVLDASAAVDALLPTRRQEAVLTLLVGQDVYAPQIIDLEVLSALARLERASDVDRREASQALRDWSQFPLTRVDSDGWWPTCGKPGTGRVGHGRQTSEGRVLRRQDDRTAAW